ncbi:MAG: ATP-binding cassette domain-containing protein [Acidimicrobiales bacterium]
MTATDIATGLEAHIVAARGGFDLDVALRIEPGETAALLGPNGSGKSTTVAALTGLLALEAGEVVLGGRTLDSPRAGIFVAPEDRDIGVVFQDYLLFDHLCVLDNVAFGLAARGLRRVTARSRARDWLDLLDLADFADRHPPQLSGGQAQRVALARALAPEPSLLLLDEPLAALDVTTHARLRRVLRTHLAGYRGPRLLITHDPADAFLLADRIHIIEDGRLTQSGTPDEIRRHPATPYVADVAGINLIAGRARRGEVTVDAGGVLHAANTAISGPVLVSVSPAAIALYPTKPYGSPRNTWEATIVAVEPLGETVRVHLGSPVPLTADITPGSAAELHLEPGRTVWLSIKATELSLTAAGGEPGTGEAATGTGTGTDGEDVSR